MLLQVDQQVTQQIFEGGRSVTHGHRSQQQLLDDVAMSPIPSKAERYPDGAALAGAPAVVERREGRSLQGAGLQIRA
jgi:hypothetical protein